MLKYYWENRLYYIHFLYAVIPYTQISNGLIHYYCIGWHILRHSGVCPYHYVVAYTYFTHTLHQCILKHYHLSQAYHYSVSWSFSLL